MPEITCDHGHTIHIGTDQWLSTLTLDQMKYARSAADERIKAAQAQPKRTVWLVGEARFNVAWYREDEYEKAVDHMLQLYKESFMREATDFAQSPYDVHIFEGSMIRVTPRRVTQLEYETEYFPTPQSPPSLPDDVSR